MKKSIQEQDIKALKKRIKAMEAEERMLMLERRQELDALCEIFKLVSASDIKDIDRERADAK